jgi:NAD-dependent dihydropyrimidine dehydrogenase PreA subunit
MPRAKKTAPTWKRWQERELPALDERRCSGSALCVQLCPTDCLAMDGATPILARPGDCINCGVCVEVCPAQALTM